MMPSIFTDELGLDVAEALPIIKGWGLEHVDFRGRVFGKGIDALTNEELADLRRQMDTLGLKVACLQSSLAKVHLPGADRRAAEMRKLEGLIRAADALDCRLVRAFHFWQPPAALSGQLAVRPDELQSVLDAFGPIAERARQAGLVLGFENCGVTPDEVFAVLDALNVPGWGLAWDVYNTWGSEERGRDETDYIRRMAKRSVMVHVKATGAIPGLHPETIPYEAVLQMCNNAGLRGPVSAETHNPDRAKFNNVELSERLVRVIQNAWPTAAPGGADSEVRAAPGMTRPWQDRPVRFVVVGLGMGHSRAGRVARTPGCALAGVCDLNEQRAKRSAEAYQVPYTTDVREWLHRDDVDVVYVMTETGRHTEVALPALEAGKHVLVTKPMEVSTEACDAMIRLAADRGLLLAVDVEMRYTRRVQSLKAAVEAGRFGRLLSGFCSLRILRTMDYFRSNGGWRGTWRWDGGGVLSNQAIHHIDELAFIFGVPARVCCNIWTQNHEIEAEDMASAVWLYENGMTVTLAATTNYPHDSWHHTLELTGTDGAYHHASGGPFDKPTTRWHWNNAWTDQAPDPRECEWINAADNFAAALRAGAPLVCSGSDGRRTLGLLAAMYRSAREADGGWVSV